MKRSPWSAATTSAPVAPKPGQDFGARSYLRPVVGLITVLAIAAIVAWAIAMFSGKFTDTVPVTVIADRAGLLMDRGAKVKLNGAQIGTISSVTEMSDGRAELKLAIDSDRLSIVPDNVRVDIGANTVFGAKSV
ncbi:MAG TPA: MlaD family protein, partial [Mycobacterium sp.]|nr:MlaD family protein [Mycobacterium sp.]